MTDQRKPEDWRKERIAYFLSKYLTTTGRRCILGYGSMMGMMSNMWAKYHGWVDEDNIVQFDIPPMEDWVLEVDGYFANKWIGDKLGFNFPYFIKSYGKHSKSVKKIVKRDTINNDKLEEWKRRMGR